LLWLKQNKPSVFKKARAFPLINEYFIKRLTGKFYSDMTGFGMSGIYNYRQNRINKKIMQILDLNEDMFPKVDRACMRGELISRQVQQEWGLDYRFPVFLCGNDQGASACGAGLKKVGDVSINFGSAMVFYAVTKSFTKIMNSYQIAGKHPVGKSYFLLNYDSDFGIQIRRLKEKYYPTEDYNRIFKTYLDHPDIDEHFLLAEDVLPSFPSQKDLDRYCAGIITYHLNRFQFHLKQTKEYVHLKKIMISGGMALSDMWLEILQRRINLPFTVNNRVNAGLIGAVYIYLQNKNRSQMYD
jgi:sugar (pentulose or hexulose) kinase